MEYTGWSNAIGGACNTVGQMTEKAEDRSNARLHLYELITRCSTRRTSDSTYGKYSCNVELQTYHDGTSFRLSAMTCS
jgi:hypothetical protein